MPGVLREVVDSGLVQQNSTKAYCNELPARLDIALGVLNMVRHNAAGFGFGFGFCTHARTHGCDGALRMQSPRRSPSSC